MSLFDFLYSRFRDDWKLVRADIAAADKRVAVLANNVSSQLALLSELRGNLKEVVTKMATREALDQAKQQLQQAISDAATRVTTDIQALRDQIANGQPISDQDLADIQSDVQALSNIDPAPTPTQQKKS